MGEELYKPPFSQKCLQTFFIFLSRAPRWFSASSRTSNSLSRVRRYFREEREEQGKKNSTNSARRHRV